MLIGETLSLFRLNQKKTQKEFCKNVISASYYAKVEKNINNISANLLFELLESNHINITEFYLAKNHQTEIVEDHIFNQIKKHYYTNSITGLQNDLLDTSLLSNQLIKKDYSIIIKELIHKLSGNKVNKKSIVHFQNYLTSVENWGRYEYQIFSLCSVIFDVHLLQILAGKFITKMAYRFQYTGYEEDVSRSLIHLAIPFIQAKLWTEAIYYLNVSDSILRESTLVYEKLLVELLRSAINLLQQINIEKNKTKIRKIQSIFKLVNLETIPITLLQKINL